MRPINIPDHPRTDRQNSNVSRPSTDNILVRLILVFALLAVSIGLAGYWYYKQETEHFKKDVQDELTAISNLKVDQINSWRIERIGDATSIMRTGFIAARIQRFFAKQRTPGLQRDILLWMKSLQEVYHYRSILLVDAKGRVRLSTDVNDSHIGAPAKKNIREALDKQSVVLSDFHRAPVVSYPHLDLVTPLIIHQEHGTMAIGAVLFRIDPQDFLFPLLQTWPGKSKTAETLLFRRDGDHVLFLNELRHRANTALTLRIPLSNSDLPAAMAVLGKTGVFEGIDYRKARVLAAARPVPGTPWFLIAKMDTGEIYAPIHERVRFRFIFVTVLVLAAGVIVILWWRQKNAEYALKQLDAEAERAALSRQYDYLSKYANDIILLINLDGRIMEANDRAIDTYGYDRNELIDSNILDTLMPPETASEARLRMDQLKSGNGMVFEAAHRRKDGGIFPVEVSSRLIDFRGKRVYQSIVRDITARKALEASLKERNDFIESILNSLPIGLAVNTIKNGKVIYMNPQFEEIYGWPKNIITDVDEFFNHVYPDPAYRKEMKEKILSDIARGDPSKMHWENVAITLPTGEKRYITAMNIPLFQQGLMISTVQNVTRHKQAEQAQIESENRYKRLVESVTDYIYTVEVENGRTVATVHGPGCVTVTGYTAEEYDADPHLWYRMVHEEDRRAVLTHAEKILSGAYVVPLEHRIVHKDGSIRWVRNTPVPRNDKDGRLIAYDSMVTDITSLKLLENQLRQAQKMEAVGQLAGGVAHDFNNILTAIIGYGNLLKMKLHEKDPLRHNVEQILYSADRAANLTSNLLAYSRKQLINPKPVDVNEIIRRVERLLRQVIGEDIDFRTVLKPSSPLPDAGGIMADLTVMADMNQMEQVFMNLCTNARDAMPQGGVLTIETDRVNLGSDFIETHSYGNIGSYALIAITDTGVGMDEKIKERIFEPFFTTKEVGKGTGLGLAMVYGIIKQHSGYINVYSEPGKGTTFRIYLPLISSNVEAPEAVTVEAPVRGTETVLLAEDDKSVRQLTKSILEDFGYTVIAAENGEDAVQMFLEHRDTVKLLVLDIIMPKKNGKEVYEEIRKRHPGIKVLFTSGYTAEIIHRQGILENNVNFISKPILPSAFLKKVREALEN